MWQDLPDPSFVRGDSFWSILIQPLERFGQWRHEDRKFLEGTATHVYISELKKNWVKTKTFCMGRFHGFSSLEMTSHISILSVHFKMLIIQSFLDKFLKFENILEWDLHISGMKIPKHFLADPLCYMQ